MFDPVPTLTNSGSERADGWVFHQSLEVGGGESVSGDSLALRVGPLAHIDDLSMRNRCEDSLSDSNTAKVGVNDRYRSAAGTELGLH